jgi:Tfp pilus assembly protein PilO
VAGALWQLVLVPLRGEVQSLEGRLADGESAIARLSSTAVALAAVQKDVARLEVARDLVRGTPSGTLDLTGVVAAVHAAAADADLRVTSMTPRAATGGNPSREVSLSVDVEGRFRSLQRLLESLASNHRVWVVPDLVVQARKGEDATGAVHASMVITAHDLLTSDVPDQDLVWADAAAGDPFAGTAAPVNGPPPPEAEPVRRGLAAVSLSTVSVRGLTRGGGVALAILETGAKQSFTVRPADRLADSVVHHIDARGVVFVQEDREGHQTMVRKDVRGGVALP